MSGLAKLKKRFATNKPLAMHDPKKKKKLQTDASDRAIKAMVFHQRKFLDYYSKKLTPAETNYITGNKKMFTIMVTLKHWRHLTQKARHKMFVHTDHKKLMFFFGNKTTESKTNPVVRKTCMLRFCNQIYKKRKQCRRRCFEQKTRLQKSKQTYKTNVG